jgi:hypothetical protein
MIVMMRVGLIGLAGLLLVTACSSTSSGSGGSSSNPSGKSRGNSSGNPPGSVDPCSLLTIDQASAIIGEPAKPPRTSAAGSQCFWESTEGAGPFIRIQVISKALYDGAANTVPRGVTKAPVDGIGDEAFAKDTGQAGHILWFRTGDKYFQVNVFALRGPLKDLDAEKQIAQDILQKL